jgi:hypothetical protein
LCKKHYSISYYLTLRWLIHAQQDGAQPHRWVGTHTFEYAGGFSQKLKMGHLKEGMHCMVLSSKWTKINASINVNNMDQSRNWNPRKLKGWKTIKKIMNVSVWACRICHAIYEIKDTRKRKCIDRHFACNVMCVIKIKICRPLWIHILIMHVEPN